jgi:hypothetical protein
LAAIGRDGDVAPGFGEHGDGEFLVHQVVLGQEDPHSHEGRALSRGGTIGLGERREEAVKVGRIDADPGVLNLNSGFGPS